MGMLVDGVWHDVWYDTKESKGHFKRQPSQFRNWVTSDGEAGPSGSGGFKAEAGRYHLYVSLACPWAHRTLIFRKLKKLEELISVSVVDPLMVENGWEFKLSDGATGDQLFGAAALWQIYVRADPHYSGRVTVPVLWDKKTGTIVNNESAEIIRMFNSAFDGLTDSTADFYPEDLRPDIDALNTTVYDTVNNGVYKAGFATTQEAYEENVGKLFETLDMLDERLGKRRYLFGNRLTEADWRLFTTLVRFDGVYVGHFKCNIRRIADYRNLAGYLRDLYQTAGVAETVNLKHIKQHYYRSHKTINPTGIVPVGPALDLDSPHGRATAPRVFLDAQRTL
ncbi:glutathione S-transferase family protein [Rhizobium beringeri]|uniref:Glutathione S-transferase family protein n=1 Tax=Rhizobium beringeri TaxID=3019934 RepID=A0ABY1XY08_9HYPH|nr:MULTISPECIES: glutathione S-transferase family protein [Rhizobium]RWX11766.1 glutathione S-transferase family protein [Rhizobium leguminosarum]TBC74176.1 glutathione S-transferase family protein [Rhizobium leguminosarum]TBE72031.1 glutathione S-transferase family protein [Rhizobium beringeri]WSG73384.1 glutathione S-transferase family protein [Rhizobium beringeri]WSH13579.1 glutathione S-transferase family protein [Rhizobium beringeri]